MRFRAAKNPLDAVNEYLSIIFLEAERRWYSFSREKINWDFEKTTLTVARGQVQYEREHLNRKLIIRDSEKHVQMSREKNLDIHPLFEIIEGWIEEWEKT